MRLLFSKHKAFTVFMLIALALLFTYSADYQEEQFLISNAVAKPSEAPDMSLCRVQLASLSKASGVPGGIFEMYGEWEDTQGAKTAVINPARNNKLEVLSWTSKTLSVRIPEGLIPGKYKVGVYCNNARYQGSNFMDFVITDPASEDTQKEAVSLPVAESSIPLVATSDSVTPKPNKGISIPPSANAPTPKQGTAYNKPAANIQSQNQITNSASEKVDSAIDTLSGMLAGIGLKEGLLIGACVIALLLILKFVKLKVDVDVQVNEVPYAKKSQGSFDRSMFDAKKFEPMSGVLNGVEYTAEELGEVVLENAFEQAVTVHIDTKNWPIKQPLEINARKMRPVIAHDNRAADINTLLDFGATYIDIGYSADWVAAELPLSRVFINRSLVEQVAECLIRIRNSS